MSLDKTVDEYEATRKKANSEIKELLEKVDGQIKKLESLRMDMESKPELSNELEKLQKLLYGSNSSLNAISNALALRTIKEIAEARQMFYDLVWYEHYKVFEYKSIDDLEPRDPDLVSLGTKAASKKEAKYGKDILSKDKFEWGMRNGKLSTLRWLLGDDWDNLDT